jgi:hypothetical protein
VSANLLAHTKDILWRKSVRVFGVVYFLLSLVDLIKTEFLPEKYQSWTFLKILPHLQWRTWIIVLLFVLLILTIDGSNETHRKVCTESEAKLNDAQEEFERERARQLRPILRGTIERFYSTQFSAEELQSDVRRDIEVLSKVLIFNESPCPTTVRSFDLTIQDVDGTHTSEYSDEAGNCVVQLGNPHQDSFGGISGSKTEEDLIDLGGMTKTTPIARGVHREGWLLFILRGVRPQSIEKGVFRLTAVDSFGFSHQITEERPPIGRGMMYKVL